NDEEIQYQVIKGERHKLAEIQFNGNRYFNAEILRERMSVSTPSLGSPYGRFNSKMLATDLDSIRSLYQKNGFLAVAAEARLEQSAEGSEEMRVLIEIKEGPQTRVGNFSITGNHAFTQEQLAGVINAGSGQPYSASIARTDGDSLLSYYLDQGFLHATFHAV